MVKNMAFSGVLLQGSECRWLGILQNLLFNRLEDPFVIKCHWWRHGAFHEGFYIFYLWLELFSQLMAKELLLYNNYSETRNLIGQQPCRIRQSGTANSEQKFLHIILQINSHCKVSLYDTFWLWSKFEIIETLV